MTTNLPFMHHVGFYASDFEASQRIFTAALEILHITAGYRTDSFVEFWPEGGDDTPSFALEPAGDPSKVTRRAHVAFSAPHRAAVDAFHEAAVAAGAVSRHVPRFWPEYRAYCAFLRDPDQNNIEALHKEL